MNPSCIRTDRWRPPKPLVGQRVLEKVLNRHTAVNCPESRLLVAVISVVFLGERLSGANWAGVGLIAAGAVLVAWRG